MSISSVRNIGKVVGYVVIACVALLSLVIPSLRVVVALAPKSFGLVAVESLFGG
ncbi:MAG: hypothetical protein JW795_22830 [Chitinivibrionales bacterium]|nr:hypothetical protein [Chitinivibrionales bacterium]